MSQPLVFEELVRNLFFDEMSSLDNHFTRRYHNNAQYHNTMNIVLDTVIVAASVLREHSPDGTAIIVGRFVQGIARKFAEGAEQHRTMQDLAARAPLLDEPNKLG